jgi:hypothetical protein
MQPDSDGRWTAKTIQGQRSEDDRNNNPEAS